MAGVERQKCTRSLHLPSLGIAKAQQRNPWARRALTVCVEPVKLSFCTRGERARAPPTTAGCPVTICTSRSAPRRPDGYSVSRPVTPQPTNQPTNQAMRTCGDTWRGQQVGRTHVQYTWGDASTLAKLCKSQGGERRELRRLDLRWDPERSARQRNRTFRTVRTQLSAVGDAAAHWMGPEESEPQATSRRAVP